MFTILTIYACLLLVTPNWNIVIFIFHFYIFIYLFYCHFLDYLQLRFINFCFFLVGKIHLVEVAI